MKFGIEQTVGPALDSRLNWADNLRVFATISVVFLHVSADSLGLFGEISIANWWIGNVYDSVVRFSVPVFVMLTGALMLPVEYDLIDFFKKRVTRIVFPLLFWSFSYIAFGLVLTFSHGQSLGIIEIIKFTFTSLLYGSSFHFWYVYMIIGMYLFVPILGKYIRRVNEKTIVFFLFFWIISLFINQYFNSVTTKWLSYFPGYFGYLILGYYLSIKRFHHKSRLFIFSIALILIGVLVTLFGTYYFTLKTYHFTERFYNYLTPNVLLVASGIFLLFKNSYRLNLKQNAVFSFLNKYSYGIYLIHILVLAILSKPGIKWDFIHPFIGPFVTTFACLIISSAIVFVASKLPFGKYISG
jgi:surface polysaccharide O-acyltransferase-like enzyme